MKKAIVIGSVVAATWAAVFFGQEGHIIPSLICTGYNAFVLWVNSKKPRAATRSKEVIYTTIDTDKRPLYVYDSTTGRWAQEKGEWRA